MANKQPLIIYHRAQNRTSIINAFAKKTDGIEFDVRMTKDGTVVVHHNRRVVNADGRYFWIERLTFDELKAIEGTNVYTLKQALYDIADQIQLLKHKKKIILDLDIKQPWMEKQVVHTLTTHAHFEYKLIVSSPNNFILSEFDRLMPSVTLGMTYAFDAIDRWDLWNSMTMRALFAIPFYSLKPFFFRLARRRTGINNIQIANMYHRLVSEKVVEFLHANHIKVYVYGTQDKERHENLKRLGVDGIKTR